MTHERSSKEVLQGQIGALNVKLHRMAERVSAEGYSPFDQETVNIEEIELPDTDFVRFWNHHLGGNTIGKASALVSFAEEQQTINELQGRAIKMVDGWMRDPERLSNDFEKSSCEGFLDAGSSFAWGGNEELLVELRDITSDLGNYYSLLYTGKELIR